MSQVNYLPENKVLVGCLCASGVNKFASFRVRMFMSNFISKNFFYTDPNRARARTCCMIGITVYAAFGVFARFTILTNVCTRCTSIRATAGSVSMAIVLAFKTLDNVRDIKPVRTVICIFNSGWYSRAIENYNDVFYRKYLPITADSNTASVIFRYFKFVRKSSFVENMSSGFDITPRVVFSV